MSVKNKKSIVATLLTNITSNTIYIYGISQVFAFQLFLRIKGEVIGAAIRQKIRFATIFNVSIKGERLTATAKESAKLDGGLPLFGKFTLGTSFLKAAEKWVQNITFGKFTLPISLPAITRLETTNFINSFGKFVLSLGLEIGFLYKLFHYDPHTLGELDDWTMGGLESRFGNVTLLNDQYTTARAAGSVNSTSAEPFGAARTVTDTNNKISISGGELLFATGEAIHDGIWYASLSRQLGKTLIATVIPSDITSSHAVGWDTNSAGAINDNIHFETGVLKITPNGGTAIVVDSYLSNTYQVALSMRVTGIFYFIKGGTFTNWSLLYSSKAGTAAGIPAINTITTTSVFKADNVKVANSPFIPIPLQSDGFSDLITDGMGSPENNGIVGTIWTDSIGVWTVSSGLANASSLVSSTAIRTITTTSPSVVAEVDFTRSGGSGGLVLRYQDTTNYLIAYHDGTNAKLDKVVAGVQTNVITAVEAYSAGATIRVSVDLNTFRLYYNNVLIGSGTITNFSTSVLHGLYTTNTANTFDNFVVWGRGLNGEYFELDIL